MKGAYWRKKSRVERKGRVRGKIGIVGFWKAAYFECVSIR